MNDTNSDAIISERKKFLSHFCCFFLKSSWNFKRFEQKDDTLMFCVSEITDSENVVRSMPKKLNFRRPFDKQHGKRAQALLKSVSHYLYQIHWSLPSQWRWKKSLLFICQILGLLVNTLAAEENYPVLKRDNLPISIEMELSLKEKNFSLIFAAFLKSRLNFERFEKKHGPHSLCISEITDSENVVR